MGRKTSRGTTQFSPARAGASLPQRSKMTIARSCHGLPPSVPTKQTLFGRRLRAVSSPVSACRTRTCSRLSAKATSRLLLLFIALWRLASLLNCGYHTIFSGTCQAKNIGKTIAGHKKGADDPCKRRNHQPKNCFIPPPQCGRRRRGWRTVRPPRRQGWS